jgi:hypothetical protein
VGCVSGEDLVWEKRGVSGLYTSVGDCSGWVCEWRLQRAAPNLVWEKRGVGRVSGKDACSNVGNVY